MPAWMKADLDERRRLGLYRARRPIASAQGARIRLGGQELINFSSNDYLNLATDSRLSWAAARAARRCGCGAGASALVSGHLRPLRALERDLARWEGTEAALVLGSGYLANLAAVTALVGNGDAVFSDELNHASLIDGCRLSRARIHVYRHASAEHLAELLEREGASCRRRLIVTDTVFSMDGDFAPLSDLLALARRHDALLLLDEAHATGVLGANGRGLTELFPPAEDDADRIVKVGTLSKALGAQGGFICGTRLLIRYLVNNSRPYIFSTALAPPIAAAARAALRIVASESQRRQHVLALAEKLRNGLSQLGYADTGSRCQIVPVIVGDSSAAVELSRRLQDRGLLVPAIRPPSVPEGTARLRVSLSAGHTEEDVQRLVKTLASGKL